MDRFPLVAAGTIDPPIAPGQTKAGGRVSQGEGWRNRRAAFETRPAAAPQAEDPLIGAVRNNPHAEEAASPPSRSTHGLSAWAFKTPGSGRGGSPCRRMYARWMTAA